MCWQVGMVIVLKLLIAKYTHKCWDLFGWLSTSGEYAVSDNAHRIYVPPVSIGHAVMWLSTSGESPNESDCI